MPVPHAALSFNKSSDRQERWRGTKKERAHACISLFRGLIHVNKPCLFPKQIKFCDSKTMQRQKLEHTSPQVTTGTEMLMYTTKKKEFREVILQITHTWLPVLVIVKGFHDRGGTCNSNSTGKQHIWSIDRFNNSQTSF